VRVYLGERLGELTTVVLEDHVERPTADEIGELLGDIRDLADDIGGLGRPDDRWEAVMARKRELIERMEAAERVRAIALPNVLGEPFEWGTRSGALAASILTVELGEQPPASIYERFASDVTRGMTGDRFRLTSGEVWEWVGVHRDMVEAGLYFDPRPPPAMAVVQDDGSEPVSAVETDGPTASALVQACEEAWAAIQAHHPQVPDAVMILGTGVERGRLVKLGHWWGGRWLADGQVRGEVLLAGEALHLPPETSSRSSSTKPPTASMQPAGSRTPHAAVATTTPGSPRQLPRWGSPLRPCRHMAWPKPTCPTSAGAATR
jgi:hypothetical protein